MHKNLDAPEGFRIEKTTDIDTGEARYVFMVDRSYAYRTLGPVTEVCISEEWLDARVVESGMERLIEDLEQCITKYKAEHSDE